MPADHGFTSWLIPMARSESRCEETETYSPSAMDTAPPMTAARPDIAMVCGLLVAPATPTRTAAVETMPSFAPRTAARRRLRGSSGFGVRSGVR